MSSVGLPKTYAVAFVKSGGDGPVIPNYEGPIFSVGNRFNSSSPCECYQQLLNSSLAPDVLIYMHDDLTIHDPAWLNWVLRFIQLDDVVVVGLGGAASLGHPDLYKRPYKIQDMARSGYASNQTDWQVHGERETGERQVAVVDAFFMAVKTDFLRSIGGWPTQRLTHHCLDLWLCLEAARAGKQVWQIGVSCYHAGGGTSTKAAYREAKWLQGGTVDEDHARPHRWLYDSCSDVLPLGVTG